MDKLETADIQIRIYPSDYKELEKESKKRRTSLAQVLHEKMEDAWKYQDLND